MPKFLNNVDLNKNELQNAVIQPLSAAPANPKEGQIYYNTTDKKYYVFDGTSWNTYQDVIETTAAGTLSIDSSPTSNSSNLVTSGGVYTAIQNVDALPSQTGQSGKYLTTDGTDASWASITIPVTSVNTKTGAVTLTASDVGALPDDTTIPQGTVTSVRVQATSPVQSSTNTAQSTSLNTTISLADAYGDTKNPYGSKTKNTVLAAPSDANGNPSFRALVAEDIPSLTTSKISDFPSTMTPSSHTHGNITNAGDITTTATIANGDRLVINDESASKITNSSITFGTSETTYLTNKGTWKTPDYPVTSVNTKTGAVSLTASDVGALPDSTVIPTTTSDLTNDSGFITSSDIPVTSVNTKTGAVSLSASDVGALPDSTNVTKWNDISLTKTSSAHYSGYVPYMSATTSTSATLQAFSSTKSSGKIAAWDSSGYLYSSTPTAGDNSGKVATTEYVDSAINELGSLLTFKGVVATTGDLPGSGNDVGDVWVVSEDNSEHVWTGSAWERLGPTIDLSGYVPTSRTINNKALSTDITLSASDVGAITDPSTKSSGQFLKYDGSAWVADNAPSVPVTSVNTKTGAVVLTASDVGALPDNTTIPGGSSTSPKMDGTATVGTETTWAHGDHIHPTDTSRAAASHTHGYITSDGRCTASSLIEEGDKLLISNANNNGVIEKSTLTFGTDTTTYLRNDGKWGTPTVPTKTSDLTNDSGYITTSDVPSASSTTPVIDGTATAGVETSWARGDHVHPTDTSRQATITASGILKGDGTGGVTAATSGTDYQAPITASGLLKGNGSGGISAAVAGTDYQAPISNNVTGSGTSGYLAKFNGTNTVTSGPALGSTTTTFLSNAGTWLTPAGTNGHSHGNITSGGDMTTTVAIASGDRLVINDESASKLNSSSITFGTSTTTFLSNAGTWATPAKGNTATTRTASLAVASWNTTNKTISVSVSGVTASNLVEVSPAPASWSVASAAGVYCSAQAANSLTFTCSSIPTAAITVNVVIWG